MSEINIDKMKRVLKENLKYPENPRNMTGSRWFGEVLEKQVREILKENFEDASDPTSSRSIEDVSIGNTFIDTKTSDESKDFKMPNMISIALLRKHIINKDKPLIYNFIIYNSETEEIVDNFLLNVYELNWDYLSIQNLGKGQLQINNMKKFLENPKSDMTKEEWISTLRKNAINFYKMLEIKTKKRGEAWSTWKT